MKIHSTCSSHFLLTPAILASSYLDKMEEFFFFNCCFLIRKSSVFKILSFSYGRALSFYEPENFICWSPVHGTKLRITLLLHLNFTIVICVNLIIGQAEIQRIKSLSQGIISHKWQDHNLNPVLNETKVQTLYLYHINWVALRPMILDRKH